MTVHDFPYQLARVRGFAKSKGLYGSILPCEKLPHARD